MARQGSLPWLIIAGVLSIGLAVLLVSAFFNPYFDAISGLEGWRGSDLAYANAGMRMVGDVAKNILLVLVFAIGFGFLIEARRRRV